MTTPQPHPRLFRLVRHTRGTGTLAEGVQWSDGTVSTRWRGPSPHTSTWDSLQFLLAEHGAAGRTQVHWLRTDDAPPHGEQVTPVWLPAPTLDGLCSRCGHPWPCLTCGP